MTIKTLLYLAPVFAVLAAPLTAQTVSVTPYNVTRLGNTYARATNVSGVSAGYFTAVRRGATFRGFTDDQGNISVYNSPNSTSTVVTGINASGVFTGYSFPASGARMSFVNDHGTVTSLQYKSNDVTQANAINDLGQVLGVTYNVASGAILAFIYGNGKYTTFQAASTSNFSADGMNNLGQTVGSSSTNGIYHGWIKTGDAVEVVDYPGAYGTRVTGINDLGDIVGFWQGSDLRIHGYIRRDGVFTSFDGPNAYNTYCYHINNNGVMTGFYIDNNQTTQGYTAVLQ